MHPCHPTSLSFERRLALLALGLALCALTPVAAQPAVAEPVEKLRLLLRAPLGDRAEREHELHKQIWALEGLGELRRALALREWRDDDQDPRVAAIDRHNRLALAYRLEQGVRNVLRQGDEACCLAVLNMLAEMGTTVRGVGTKHSAARPFGTDLAELTRRGAANIRAAALRTLGQIDPEPEVALSAFRDAFFSDDAEERLAASDGLAAWIRTTAELATRGADSNHVEVAWSDFVAVGRAVIPLAACGLHAAAPEIRRRCAAMIGYSAMILHTRLRAAYAPAAIQAHDGSRRSMVDESTELAPLILTIADQRLALTQALVDADGHVRSLADRALEDITILESSLPQPLSSSAVHKTALVPASEAVPSSGFVPITSPPEEPRGAQTTVQALAAQLADTNVEARREALETLETLGPEAAPALAALVGALGDQDKFIRWAAARTLGRIGPAAEEAVVLALARLLTDGDLEVRLAAATALERWGSAAKAAVPDLRRTIGTSDAELRCAALRALGAIGGPDADTALSEITAALADPDVRVRQVAAQVLGKFGPSAQDAVPALQQALQDESSDVQRVAGEALLKILRRGKE